MSIVIRLAHGWEELLADFHDARDKVQCTLEVGGADLRLLSLAAWI